ncbi:MAG: ABC transporter permease subunit [Candidatus Zixiibacteriota bacterium]
MINRVYKTIWGGANALLNHSRRIGWIDLLLLVSFFGILYAVIGLAHRWTGQLRPTIEIDLSALALPRYALYSLSRGLIAYVFSLTFTLIYGYWAAKDAVAGKVLIPLLDILQSVPVLGFMPGLILALVAVFPTTNIGLELAAIIMIFTGQAWNMTFSFYHSLKSLPSDLAETSTVYGFNWRQRFRWLELPFSAMGLVWNSMMSMAGGWFFLMINEAFVLGDHDFRLPGIGSYMSVAVARGDANAMIMAIVTMILMIVLLDQLLWRPIVAWAQKFRLEEGGYEESVSSWFLNWLRRSAIFEWITEKVQAMSVRAKQRIAEMPARKQATKQSKTASYISHGAVVILVVIMLYGSVRLFGLLAHVTREEWLEIVTGAGLTLGRVLIATLLGTIWALPAGLAIGLSPRLSRIFQPIVQVAASFPAPMLFPAVIGLLIMFDIPLGWGSIFLMMLGTQWYILFNVVAGAMAIPADMREAARAYRLSQWQRFTKIYVPAVFPYLVTGWVTAAGGGWNASIVAEFVSYKGETITSTGLGDRITEAAASANFPVLAASIIVMSTVVVLFNRTVWRRLYLLAQEQFSLR